MEFDTHLKTERNFKKISAFLNVPTKLLSQQHPNLIMKMIEAADEDNMIEIHHLGMEMKGRF
jgi:hypothetical protein